MDIFEKEIASIKNMNLHVQRDDAFGDREFYIIQERSGNRRWWTASWQGDGWYLMTGNQNRVVQEGGILGKKLVKAINDYKQKRAA